MMLVKQRRRKMKNYLPFAFISFLISPIATAAEDPIYPTVDVNVVKMPSVVLEPVSAHYLQSEVFSIKAKPYNGDEFVIFKGLDFILKEISFVPVGSCRLNFKINGSLVKIMQWHIVEDEKLNKGAIIAGEWQPPGAIVFTPKDVLTVGLEASDKDAVCAADFVALAQMLKQ